MRCLSFHADIIETTVYNTEDMRFPIQVRYDVQLKMAPAFSAK